MDKLSELSKPVFEIEISDGYWLNCSISPLQPRDGAKFNGWPDGVNRLYSQEYVSALDKVAQYWIGESAGWKKRAEDAEKRIAELERANTSQDDHINQQQDRIDSLEKTNAGLGQRLGAAEKRLATPVRLPDMRQSASGDRYQWSDGAHNYRLDVISMLLGAGFTVAVEGD
ncbi:SlyX family protein [Serratia marcescens]|uniref:SlyX family protein n=1 Tax=Serratia marcescens TaxID=615 RepID=UPI0013D9AA27|nr:SlyX family protein [Serratia marcescens]